jgi:hypothetical protein
MPPPDVVTILLPLKEKTPIRPNDPAGRPPYEAPSASAASSMSGTPNASATGISAEYSAHEPNRSENHVVPADAQAK